MLCHSCRRRLQHVLCKVNKNLVELSTTQQVEVFDDLREKTNINSVHLALIHGPELSVMSTNLELFKQI